MNTRFPYTQIDKTALGPRLSVAGYAKVGGRRTEVRWSQNGPYVLPTSYTDPVRFEVTTREKDTREVERNGKTYKVDFGYRRDEEIHEAIGDDAPKKLDIRLMFPRVEDNLVTHFGAHSGKRWVCQGNGVEATDITRGKVSCPCPRLEQFEGDYDDELPPEKAARGAYVPCKPRGVLSFVLEAAESYGRFHVFKTTSWESIANIRTQLEIFEQQFGRLDGLPLRLVVYPATKGYGRGEGVTTQPIVTVEIPASFETARQIATGAVEETRKLAAAASGGVDPDEVRELLTREMQEEAESEGGEYFPEVGTTKAGPSLQEKIDARREAGPPVVQAEPENGGEASGEPDYEVVDEGEGEEAPWYEEDGGEPAQEPPDGDSAGNEPEAKEPRKGKNREEMNRLYFARLSEVRPDWGDVERKLWQEQKIGKASARDFDLDDYKLALLLIDRGQMDVILPEGKTEGEAEQTSAAL